MASASARGSGRFRGPGFALGGTRLALLGRFQAGNALLATAVAQRLGLPEAAIRAGLAGVRWPVRATPRGDLARSVTGYHLRNAATVSRHHRARRRYTGRRAGPSLRRLR